MSNSVSLWALRRRAVRRAQKSIRAGERTSLHDIRVALRRVAATAGALGRRKIARRAKEIVSSLSDDRQLEVDRALLRRVGLLGLLSEDSAIALGARWAVPLEGSEDGAEAVAKGKRMTRLLRELRSLSAHVQPGALERLLAERSDVEAALAASPDRKDDEALHRYRLRVKRARYLAEDLVECGRADFGPAAVREKAAQEALGRWNDLRLFLEHVDRERELAERRGAVRLASELHELARSLDSPLKGLRTEATDVAQRLSALYSTAVKSA